MEDQEFAELIKQEVNEDQEGNKWQVAAICLELLAKTYLVQADAQIKDTKQHKTSLFHLKLSRKAEVQQNDDTSSEEEDLENSTIFAENF